MSEHRTLRWHRRVVQGKADGYGAVDGPARYIIRRDPAAPDGSQWTLIAEVAGRNPQTRTGLGRKSTAQEAALHTRCHVCGRHVPFADTEPSGNSGGWRCRDRSGCEAAARENNSRRQRRIAALRDTDLEAIGITDTEDVPELVFVRAGTGARTRIEVTSRDLDRLRARLAVRNGSTVAYTVIYADPYGSETPLSSGWFQVDPRNPDAFPDEDAAREAAVSYARTLAGAERRLSLIVRRTEATAIGWDETP